jgi:threonine dehydrogenase-like Zn-dependent dehydrogenase
VIGIDRNEKRVQDIRNAKLVDHMLSISSNAPNLVEQITKITGKGVDIVIDCVGGEHNKRSLYNPEQRRYTCCGWYVWKRA